MSMCSELQERTLAEEANPVCAQLVKFFDKLAMSYQSSTSQKKEIDSHG